VSQQEEQVEIAQRLQSKWLRHMEKLLDEGTITSTDMATLGRVLVMNGWTLDPKRLPKQLKDLMTTFPLKLVDFDEDDEPKRELPPPLGYDPDAKES